MIADADLEIAIHRRDADNYAIELRFTPPNDEGEVRLIQGGPALAHFDLADLRGLSVDIAAYGDALSKSLFHDEALKAAFIQARSNAEALSANLRVRLFVDPTAPELHTLWWELLRDPRDGNCLFTSEQILFSRYLSSVDWRPVRLRPRSELSALVVIANPTDLNQYRLAPVDVAGELERAKAGLGNIALTSLDSGGRANLTQIIDEVRNGYDILYLVCHGAIIEGEPRLWLERASGKTDVVAGNEFVTRLRELQQRPRLVVLGSCQSAGSGAEGRSGDKGALAALGPLLAWAGIPAVLAMQGNVTMQTVAGFMPVFFRELRRDGQIDRAVAVARGQVRDRPDYGMPVLFMRLRSGRIWYVPGFGDDRQAFERWPGLQRSILRGPCTPILGPGLNEQVLGSSREIAQRWAEMYHFPMAPHDKEDLPHVAQFLAVNQGQRFPHDELVESMRQEILGRYENQLRNGARHAPLDELIKMVGKRRRESDPAEPNRVLAELPFSIYITTNVDSLLEEALADAGKQPQSEICPWNDYIELLPSVYKDEPNYRPDTQRPLVYHLFGKLSEPDSLVLTEDDYFDHLIRATSNKELIPKPVRRALTDAALLFLGFHLDDWNFRVLFRSIMSQAGGARRLNYAHVAAQIDPEEGRILEPKGARQYLEKYFQPAHISIYWGTTEDFMRELVRRLTAGTV
jgi:hypothetical protein